MRKRLALKNGCEQYFLEKEQQKKERSSCLASSTETHEWRDIPQNRVQRPRGQMTTLTHTEGTTKIKSRRTPRCAHARQPPTEVTVQFAERRLRLMQAHPRQSSRCYFSSGGGPDHHCGIHLLLY